MNEVEANPGLKLYHPACLAQEGMLGINRFHDISLEAAEALAISRLLAGGQGLRSGDPKTRRPATPRTACFYCLLHARDAVPLPLEMPCHGPCASPTGGRCLLAS